jgi:hypothetical protein
MTAMGLAAFALVVWGSVVCVSLVFLYELYAVAGDVGWLDAG